MWRLAAVASTDGCWSAGRRRRRRRCDLRGVSSATAAAKKLAGRRRPRGADRSWRLSRRDARRGGPARIRERDNDGSSIGGGGDRDTASAPTHSNTHTKRGGDTCDSAPAGVRISKTRSVVGSLSGRCRRRADGRTENEKKPKRTRKRGAERA